MLPFKKNIACIEGRWVQDFTKPNSVAAGLELLQNNKIIRKQCCKNSHFKATTLDLLLEFTQKRYASYSLLYLSFHGEPGAIGLGKERVTLDELEERLAGKLTGKILHFGSCQTVNINKRRLTKFLVTTKAAAVSGFTTDVAFLESTLFDLLYFETCQYRDRVEDIQSDMSTNYGAMSRRLGFRMVIHP
ncbi:DUF6642 family protein [Hymenobacter sp. DG01]|uniref:DUF6642 family protein n=1 Tax=Hymenobacter sp. DG01 TaxID=2584940 RepID=UPI0011238A91|nr:DUF6642 family protein [Hymenobacter sp. DG01]